MAYGACPTGVFEDEIIALFFTQVVSDILRRELLYNLTIIKFDVYWNYIN
jgi:hypothetical protein